MTRSIFTQPHPPLTARQARAIDQQAVDTGIPSVVLMENAARQLAEHTLQLIQGQLLKRPNGATVTLLCGGGNNGGDGFAAARHLHNAGTNVQALTVKPVDELDGDAQINAKITASLGLVQPIPDATQPDGTKQLAETCAASDVVIDALLGTGITGDVREPTASVIRCVNAARHQSNTLRVIAADCPSGLNVDTGEPGEPTVRADLTVTFVARKKGFAAESAKPFLGEVVVADIGYQPGAEGDTA